MYPDWNLRGYVAETFTVAKVLKFLITNDPFVYAHLWFLFALIYCYLFFCIFKTRDRIPEYFAIIVLLLLATFTILAELNGVLGIRNSIAIPGSDKTLVISSFCFSCTSIFMAGIVLREKSEKIISKRYNNKIFLFMILFGEGLSLVERYLLRSPNFM